MAYHIIVYEVKRNFITNTSYERNQGNNTINYEMKHGISTTL